MKKIVRKFFFAVVPILILVVILIFCRGGIGFGNGRAQTDNGKIDEREQGTVIIRVDESTIYVNEEKCDSIDAFKEKLSEIAANEEEKNYVYEHEYAIKEVADEVESTLRNLEKTIGIKVQYN